MKIQVANTKMSFQKFWECYGNDLLRGWLRAREDGSDEDSFADWVIAEYDMYMNWEDNAGELEDAGDYEVPYHGLMDAPTEDEIKILGDPRIFIHIVERSEPDD